MHVEWCMVSMFLWVGGSVGSMFLYVFVFLCGGVIKLDKSSDERVES